MSGTITSDQTYGVYYYSGCTNAQIGGNTAGDGNVISSNITGVFIGCNSAVVEGNIIGLQDDGITYISSNPQNTGLTISTANTCTVGGTTS